MIDRFVKFEGSSNQMFRGRMRITLSPKNFFMLNEAVFEALGSPAAVEFYFDAHERKIGVKGCDPDARYAFRVGKDRMAYIIHAGAFCRHNLIKRPTVECCSKTLRSVRIKCWSWTWQRL